MAWHVDADGDVCVLSRAAARVFAPYAVALAITIAWYPLAAAVLGALDVAPSSGYALAAFAAPIAGLAVWVPRLARTRRRISIVRDPGTVSIDRVPVARARLDGIAVVPLRTALGPRRSGVIALLDAPPDACVIVVERDVDDARRLASALASWLDIPAHLDGPPMVPRAIVVEPRRERADR